MPGVLVDQQSFPSFVDPHVFSTLFDDYHPPSLPRSLPPSDDLPRVSSPLNPQAPVASEPPAVDERRAASSAFRGQHHSALSLSALHAFEGFGTPPSSPADRSGGSPRAPNFDAREEFGRKVFSRSLSKFGGAQGLLVVNEDLVLQDASVFEGGTFCEGGGGGGGEANCPLHLTGRESELIGGVSIPLSGAFGSSPRGGGGAFVGSPDVISALQKYLPSNNEDEDFSWPPQADAWPPLGNVYSCDEFRMYEFKVRKCMRGRSHDWTECPFAHPGEKARRRDPRRFHYSGIACPDFRKGSCRRGDACEYAHGVFECWLHPARYRTQPCKDGRNCKRRVCFFAHTNEQLRYLPGSVQSVGGSGSTSSRASLHSPSLKASLGGSYDGSPLRQALAGSFDGAMAFESLSCLGPNGLYDGVLEGRTTGSPRGSHLGFLGKSAHELCGNSSHISSPTSTLVGHSHSPPPLSPPLSPSTSPPMSPDPSSSWPTGLARNLSCLSAPATIQQPLSSTSFQGAFSQAALSHVQASIAACTQNSGCLSTNTSVGPSPLSATIPAHRRHLDRLQSMPTISIPLFEGKEATYMASPLPVSKELHCTQAMPDLIAALQQLEMQACTKEAANRVPAFWSPKGLPLQQRHLSQSVPCTPTKVRWAGQLDPWEVRGGEEVPVERVESGRDLRAEIYGRLGRECLVENESPNVDWVNELVK